MLTFKIDPGALQDMQKAGDVTKGALIEELLDIHKGARMDKRHSDAIAAMKERVFAPKKQM